MARFAKPAGGLRLFKAIAKPPKLVRLNLGSPAKILFITDLHLRKEYPSAIDALILSCEGLNPDIICLGGDMAEYDQGIEIVLGAIRAAFPKTPIYAVPGNNDDHLFDGDRQVQKRVYERFWVEYLTNECRRFSVNGRKIELAGLEDAYEHEPKFEGLFSNDKTAYRILLAHQPLEVYLKANSDLMLCGHTHGGQINVLGICCYTVTPYERKYAYALLAGVKRFGNTNLLVSRGIGYSKLPIRFGARSEIHFIE